jgi:hypothetical protein
MHQYSVTLAASSLAKSLGDVEEDKSSRSAEGRVVRSEGETRTTSCEPRMLPRQISRPEKIKIKVTYYQSEDELLGSRWTRRECPMKIRERD